MKHIKRVWKKCVDSLKGLLERAGVIPEDEFFPCSRRNQNALLAGIPMLIITIVITAFFVSGSSDSPTKNELFAKQHELQEKIEKINSGIMERENELEQLKSMLASTKGEIEKKAREMQAKDAELQPKQSGISIKENEIKAREEELSSCIIKLDAIARREKDYQAEIKKLSEENSDFKDSLAKRREEINSCVSKKELYKEAISNSVRDVCCNFGDSRKGTQKNWAIANGDIICLGGSAVNCGNGIVYWDS